MILSHNGRTLVCDRYTVELDEAGHRQPNIGITLNAHLVFNAK